MPLVTYTSNNSGGSWWLTDEDWHALERAGWNVRWVKDDESYTRWGVSDGRWLGALAKEASKEFATPREAIDEFEMITGQDASAEGCNCCGEPHSFAYEDAEGKTHYSSVHVVETSIGFS